eukprot:6252400-Prymnesium_polylepis.1
MPGTCLVAAATPRGTTTTPAPAVAASAGGTTPLATTMRIAPVDADLAAGPFRQTARAPSSSVSSSSRLAGN